MLINHPITNVTQRFIPKVPRAALSATSFAMHLPQTVFGGSLRGGWVFVIFFVFFLCPPGDHTSDSHGFSPACSRTSPCLKQTKRTGGSNHTGTESPRNAEPGREETALVFIFLIVCLRYSRHVEPSVCQFGVFLSAFLKPSDLTVRDERHSLIPRFARLIWWHFFFFFFLTAAQSKVNDAKIWKSPRVMWVWTDENWTVASIHTPLISHITEHISPSVCRRSFYVSWMPKFCLGALKFSKHGLWMCFCFLLFWKVLSSPQWLFICEVSKCFCLFFLSVLLPYKRIYQWVNEWRWNSFFF